jgi:hypothetical protein
VLKGCDGVVFVADSQRSMQEANRESLAQLSQHLSENGLVFAEVPLVLQYNKQDLPDLLSVDELDTDLNPANVPFFEAVASEGIGVEDTLKAVIRLVLKNLVEKALVMTVGEPAILEERGAAKDIVRDTSPGFTPEPQVQSDGGEAGTALIGDDSSELAVELDADPFTELQPMEADVAADSTSAAPEGPLQGTAPEWLFSEPGEDTASLLAVASPIADAVIPPSHSPEELFNDPESPLGRMHQDLPPSGTKSLPPFPRRPRRRRPSDIPSFMASGQIHQVIWSSLAGPAVSKSSCKRWTEPILKSVKPARDYWSQAPGPAPSNV